jgi:thiamine biosynthesis lipoprotein
MSESRETCACFGSECTVIVDSDDGGAADVADARRRLLEWHLRFSRFEPDSELSALNRDPAATVAVSPLMRRVLEAAVDCAVTTDGLVDPTLLTEIELAGYDRHFDGDHGLALAEALPRAPVRRPAGAHPLARWREIAVDRRRGVVTRPPGVKLDPGGIAKGVFADELAAGLSAARAFAIDCAGDLRVGGSAGLPRQVLVESPFDGSVLHAFELSAAGIATSGIGRRSWLGADAEPAHHLLDPATGRPAFTGLVQATAIAPTAAKAEALSKAALLSGPDHAARWLPHGGVLVRDDGRHVVIAPT